MIYFLVPSLTLLLQGLILFNEWRIFQSLRSNREMLKDNLHLIEENNRLRLIQIEQIKELLDRADVEIEVDVSQVLQ
jgi:hypothetical protein